MSHYLENGNVLEILDSDDEGGDRQSRPEAQNNGTVESDDRRLENRSFWKAGVFDVGPVKWNPTQDELEHARVHPKFLHSNATSHKWAFGAIAELLDNAVDEIINGATFVKVDRVYSKRDNSPALLFIDDGGGMDPEGMRKCMSLGYSTKKSNKTIGQYGNGFKTSTMRLGADVIVFSRASRNGKATQSVGLLSYTFLRRTGQDDVIVPMIDFDISNPWVEPLVYGSQDDWSTNLKTILEWSPFASKDDLLQQFEDIGSHGTKVLIYNLWLNDEGVYELNFDEDDEDIKLRDEASRSSKLSKKQAETQAHISSRLLHSLRAYASMLYLKKFKNFTIYLRGKPVEQFNIADDLNYPEVVTYRPQSSSLKDAVVLTTLGFIKEAPALPITGFNVYHKNRLIRPFWKVTGEGHSKGYGIVGVLEANFIEPAHDKQDFERSTLFSRLESKLKQIQMDYWKSHCHLIGHTMDQSYLRKMEKTSSIVPPVETQSGQTVDFDNTVHGQTVNTTPTHVQSQSQCQSQTVFDNGMPISRAPPGFETAVNQEVASGDKSREIDRLCSENIQLFMSCEQLEQRQNGLRTTVEDLTKQVTDTKKKCAEIYERIEFLRRRKLVR